MVHCSKQKSQPCIDTAKKAVPDLCKQSSDSTEQPPKACPAGGVNERWNHVHDVIYNTAMDTFGKVRSRTWTSSRLELLSWHQLLRPNGELLSTTRWILPWRHFQQLGRLGVVFKELSDPVPRITGWNSLRACSFLPIVAMFTGSLKESKIHLDLTKWRLCWSNSQVKSSQTMANRWKVGSVISGTLLTTRCC